MFEVFLQPRVNKDFNKLEKRDRVRWAEVNQELGKLMEDPYGESIPLIDPYWKGLRRARTNGDRIRFQICEECRREASLQKSRGCIDCGTIPPNGVKVFDIEIRKSAYKQHKKR